MYKEILFYNIVFFVIQVIMLGAESSYTNNEVIHQTLPVSKDCADYGSSVGTMLYDLKRHNGVIEAHCGLYNATQRNSYTITWFQRQALGPRKVLKECKFNVSEVNHFFCIHPLKLPRPKEIIACVIQSTNEWNTEIRTACISADIIVIGPTNRTNGENNEISGLIYKYDWPDEEKEQYKTKDIADSIAKTQQDILMERNLTKFKRRETQRLLQKRKLLPWAPWIDNFPGVKLMGVQYFLLILGVLFAIVIISGALSAFFAIRKHKEHTEDVKICKCKKVTAKRKTLDEIRRKDDLNEIEYQNKKELKRKRKEDKSSLKEECEHQIMEKQLYAEKQARIKKAKKRSLVIKNNEVFRIKKPQVKCGCHDKLRYPLKVKSSKNCESEEEKFSKESICECNNSTVFQDEKKSNRIYSIWKHRKDKESNENNQINSNAVYHKEEVPKRKIRGEQEINEKKRKHFAHVENNQDEKSQNENCGKYIVSKVISQNSENEKQNTNSKRKKFKERIFKKQKESKEDNYLYYKDTMHKKEKFNKINSLRPCICTDKVPNRNTLKKPGDLTNKKHKSKRISFSPYCVTYDSYITESNRINSLPSIYSYYTKAMCNNKEKSFVSRRNSFSSLHEYYNEIYYNETFY